MKRSRLYGRIACCVYGGAALLLVGVPQARAHIYQWEYINPSDPMQGKQQSAVICPDGAGVNVNTGWYVSLRNRDLSKAWLHGANLTNVDLYNAVLSQADLNSANLTNASFNSATLAGADFTGATIHGASYPIRGAFFEETTAKGFTAAQLYSTASYQSHDLTGVNLAYNNLTGWNFAGQNLTRTSFGSSTLTGISLTGATIKGTSFDNTTDKGFTAALLYGTPSYQARELTGIRLRNNDLSGWNFAGQDLSFADFSYTDLTGTDLTGATIKGAGFFSNTSRGFTAAQLYSTASYQAHDLTTIHLDNNDLSGWNFAGQNLTNAAFSGATLTGTDFAGATINGADFENAQGFTAAQLYSTASYQAHDLSGVQMQYNDLSGWNFAGQNLTKAWFYFVTLTGTDFTGATIKGTFFNSGTYHGFTAAQLYSTASYQAHHLSGVDLGGNNLTGWNFAGQNLTYASFDASDLTGADLTNVDARKSGLHPVQSSTAASVNNLIDSDGYVNGMNITAGMKLRLWDYQNYYNELIWTPIDIYIQQQFTLDPAGTLRMVFEDDAWGSKIVFDVNDGAGIPVSLAGTLELEFDNKLSLDELADLDGVTYTLFDWTYANRAGWFDQITYAGPGWFDTSLLAATGQVTYHIPEPASLAILGLGGLLMLRRRK